MEKWFIKNIKADFGLIARQFGVSEVLAHLSVNRGIKNKDEMERYLNPELACLHPPALLKDIEKSADILFDKIKKHKKVRIVGDYDVDGVISTYLLKTALDRLGAASDYEIPDRIKDGYGINQLIVEQAVNDGIDTIITCDNGIAAIEQITYAKNAGLTVIITDHHDIPFQEKNGEKKYYLPQADAVVNPKQQDCTYPFSAICGAVVVYKLIQYMYARAGIPAEEGMKFLQFAAIATICDVMDLRDENRIIVKNGLDMLHKTEHIGLNALIKENQLEVAQISVYHIGFVIGPCINASGRLDSAKLGLRLLLSDSPDEVKKLASELKNLNEERKELTRQGVKDAVDVIEHGAFKEDKVYVIYLEHCHESIAGIIAGRIKDTYNKPTIVLTRAEDGVKGSARSIEEYNMFEGLTRCKHHLTKFGGHPMAAGMSLLQEEIEPLREELNQNAVLTEEDLKKKIVFDMMLPFEKITIPMIRELRKLEPYGNGNKKPLFAVRNIHVRKAAVMGKNKNVLRFTVCMDNSMDTYTAILFESSEQFEEKVQKAYGNDEIEKVYQGIDNNLCLDLLYYPDINEYKGYQKIQMVIQNYRFC